MSDPDELPEHEPGVRAPRPAREPAPSDPRRTAQLRPTSDDWSAQEPVNPEWRRSRVTGRGEARQRTTAALPSSSQGAQVWLQRGGWRYVAVAGLIFVVALIALLWFNQRQRGAAQSAAPAAATTAAQVRSTVLTGQPTVTSAPATPVPPPVQFFVVAGTEGQGLFLRPDHNAGGAPLETLPDGTRVEKLGEDFAGPDRVWRKVRAPGGQEGWVAADFLQPAP